MIILVLIVRTECFQGDPYNLSRSSSQSQFANERKISQLERQIASAHTDTQMMKREIEVYKSTLAENEKVSSEFTINIIIFLSLG